MIEELENWGLIKKHKGSYVLSRRGQKVFSKSGSDPFFWKNHNEHEGMIEEDFLGHMDRLFGAQEIFIDKGKGDN